MNIEAGLRSFLLAAPALAALVGPRVYGLLRPQTSDLPAAMIQRITTARQVLFCGTDKLVEVSLQVDAFAMTGDVAWGVADALRALLVDFTGMMGAVYVDQCTLENEFPLVDPEPGIIRVTQLYHLWYVED
jgi:hypothetical protein